jgi:transposase, IS30 family
MSSREVQEMSQGPWVTRGERREVAGLLAAGLSQREVAARVGRSKGAVEGVVRACGGVIRRDEWNPSPWRLSREEREDIADGLRAGESCAAIGRLLGRSTSTVTREVNGNGGRAGYRPAAAHRRACEQARRPKPTKLAENPLLAAAVIAGLEELWSPKEIESRLRFDHPEDPTMWVSHETIYKSIYVQGRGELRRELARCLRSGRATRRPQGASRMDRPGRIPGAVSISERPAEVEDRAVPGHWEGDLIIGARNRSAIGTLVERATRYVVLLHLPDGYGAQAVRDAMTAATRDLPAHLMRSITWDRGSEMTQHANFSVDTGIDVYFCDPRSPWQRGSNENTNGLLRQWFPKGTDLSQHSAEDLTRVAASLNNRPRQTLGWMKPSEKLTELLIASTG